MRTTGLRSFGLLRTAAVAAAAALVLTSCGSRADVFETPAPAGSSPAELPEPTPAAPAFLAVARDIVRSEVLGRVRDVEGVAVASAVRVAWMRVSTGSRTARLRVAAIDTLTARSVATPAVRDADFVWRALLDGQAIVAHRAARKLALAGPEVLSLGHVATARVGGFADMLEPNVADVVIDEAIVADDAFMPARLLAIGAETGTSLRALRRELHSAVPQMKLRRMQGPASAPPPSPQPPTGLLGPMRYQILKGGFIRPDDAWVALNIATGTVPIIGSVRCHRLVLPQLAAALGEIEERGLAGEIRTYDGCFVPRFIGRDPSRPLSMHAFGLAVDFNASTNALGTRGSMHPDVVAIFEKWGFEWGGWWSTPDPMHFELARLVHP